MQLEVFELLDDAQAMGYRQALEWTVARGAIVAVHPDLSQDADALEPIESLVKALDEVPAAHLAVGDNVDAGSLLIQNGEVDRVVERLARVAWAVFVLLDCFERGPEPARNRVTSDNSRRKQTISRGHGPSSYNPGGAIIDEQV